MIHNAVFLFSTFGGSTVDGRLYNYRDNLDDGSSEITFPSQFIKKSRDVFLTDGSVSTYVFTRTKKHHRFQFAGKVTDRILVSPRTNDSQLIMRFTLDPADTSLCQPNTVFLDKTAGRGRFKLPVYHDLNATPTIGDGVQEGIVPVHIANL